MSHDRNRKRYFKYSKYVKFQKAYACLKNEVLVTRIGRIIKWLNCATINRALLYCKII